MKKMMVYFFIHFCIVFYGVSGAAKISFADEGLATLSPYFEIAPVEAFDPDKFFLRNTEVEVHVTGTIAHVTVKQEYRNTGTVPVTGTYVFPASTRAAVHGLTMTIGERIVKAEIKEKKQAKAIYEKARAEGKNASLLEQKRPNVFKMSVANIMPGDTIVLELQYTELLVPTDGTYEFMYPTVVGPRFSDAPVEKAQGWIKNPYMTQGKNGSASLEAAPQPKFSIKTHISAGMPLVEVIPVSHSVDVQWNGQNEAVLILKDVPDNGANRDYVVRYRLMGKAIQTGLSLHRAERENFFLLMLQPPKRVLKETIPAREYIFVLDVSGSMNGFPLNTAKELMQNLIGNLRPTDTFNILTFAGNARLLSPVSLPATRENLNNALTNMHALGAGGGTRLYNALDKALHLPQDKERSRTMLVVTDGYISAEMETFELIEKNLDKANVFTFGIGSSVNRYLIKGLARAGRGEPFVVLEPSQAKGVANKLMQYINNPVLTNIQVQFKGFEAYDVEPLHVPDLFAGRPLLIQGKYRGKAQGTITITGKTGAGPYKHRIDVKTVGTTASPALPYLWARERIARLDDYQRALGSSDEIRAEVTNLGLTYNLLTRFTSFVAVDHTVRNPEGIAKNVKQPLPLPQGVEKTALSRYNQTPEPEFVLLLLGVVLVMAIYVKKKKAQGTGAA